MEEKSLFNHFKMYFSKHVLQINRRNSFTNVHQHKNQSVYNYFSAAAGPNNLHLCSHQTSDKAFVLVHGYLRLSWKSIDLHIAIQSAKLNSCKILRTTGRTTNAVSLCDTHFFHSTHSDPVKRHYHTMTSKLLYVTDFQLRR